MPPVSCSPNSFPATPVASRRPSASHPPVPARKGHRGLQHGGVEIGLSGVAAEGSDSLPGQVQLLGYQGGEGGVHALTHLGARRDDGHALGIDDQIGIQGYSRTVAHSIDVVQGIRQRPA